MRRGASRSRALRSEDDGLYKFGIAAPVYRDGTWAGVLLATIGTDFRAAAKAPRSRE